MNFTDIERDAYEDHLEWLMTEASTLKKYEQRYREEGREEGRVEGRVEIAKAMISDNEKLEKIIKYTGLTERQIRELHHNK